MIKLYENIKYLRKQNKWTQDDLAKKMGYTDRSMIAKIETGAVDLAESKIMAFAKVFGVKPSDLMGLDDVPFTSSSYDLLPDEASLIDNYRSLNLEGKKEVDKHMKYIVSQEEYIKDTSVSESVS